MTTRGYNAETAGYPAIVTVKGAHFKDFFLVPNRTSLRVGLSVYEPMLLIAVKVELRNGRTWTDWAHTLEHVDEAVRFATYVGRECHFNPETYEPDPDDDVYMSPPEIDAAIVKSSKNPVAVSGADFLNVIKTFDGENLRREDWLWALWVGPIDSDACRIGSFLLACGIEFEFAWDRTDGNADPSPVWFCNGIPGSTKVPPLTDGGV